MTTMPQSRLCAHSGHALFKRIIGTGVRGPEMDARQELNEDVLLAMMFVDEEGVAVRSMDEPEAALRTPLGGMCR